MFESTKRLAAKLRGEDRKHTGWILEQADKWRDGGAGYRDEMARRRSYLDEEMESDALEFLKTEFEKTWKDMQYKQVLWPIAKWIIDKKAQVFRGAGQRFYLKNPKTGEEIDPSTPPAQSFAAMVESSQLPTTLVDIDKAVEMMHSCAAKVGWSGDALELYAYDPDKAHIAVNGDRENDAYAAKAVAFERTGAEGINDEPRYEIWGTRDAEVADDRDAEGRALFDPQVHYMSTKNGSQPINDLDVNPFKDRRTGRPMYPFTWFRDNRRAIYKRGGDNLVRFTRVLNLGLTYLNHNMHWQMAVLPKFEVQPGQNTKALEQLKQITLSSPNKALKIPAGISFSFVSPDGEIGPFLDAYELLVQYYALMHQLSPKSIDVKNGLPSSGIALRIEMDSLIKYRDERVELLRPHVLDFLNRCVTVWNYYAPKLKTGWARIPDELAIGWDAGRLEAGPKDYVEIGSRFQNEIAHNVSSVVDWAASVWGVTREQAVERVEQNAEENQKFGTRYPEEPTAADDAGEDLDQVVDGDQDKTGDGYVGPAKRAKGRNG